MSRRCARFPRRARHPGRPNPGRQACPPESVKPRPGATAGLLLALLATVIAWPTGGDTVMGSRHDLSSTGVDPYSNRVCVFCHTPHFANTNVVAPLWNRFVDLSTPFALYSSATLDTVPEQPFFSVSMVCLGCHDGTLGTAVVNGISGSTKHDLVNAPGPGGMPDMTSYPNCERCHPDIYGGPAAKWLGTDLSDEHPISMTYPTAAQDPAFRTPPDLTHGWPDVKLFQGKVECPSCHDVHDPAIEPFLSTPNLGSTLCLRCHIK